MCLSRDLFIMHEQIPNMQRALHEGVGEQYHPNWQPLHATLIAFVLRF